MDLVDIGLFKLVVSSLPADQVPDYHKSEDAHGGCGAPVDERVSEEEVLDDGVVPTAHAETDVENGPLPELRSEIILLVWIGNKGVV